jgi:hypothetical protein
MNGCIMLLFFFQKAIYRLNLCNNSANMPDRTGNLMDCPMELAGIAGSVVDHALGMMRKAT